MKCCELSPNPWTNEDGIRELFSDTVSSLTAVRQHAFHKLSLDQNLRQMLNRRLELSRPQSYPVSCKRSSRDHFCFRSIYVTKTHHGKHHNQVFQIIHRHRLLRRLKR